MSDVKERMFTKAEVDAITFELLWSRDMLQQRVIEVRQDHIRMQNAYARQLQEAQAEIRLREKEVAAQKNNEKVLAERFVVPFATKAES